MSKIKLSYSTFGLTKLSIIDAINAVADAGYAGIELAFHKRNFNPFKITNELLDQIKETLAARSLAPACISAPTHFFMNERPHEPALLSTDIAGRKQRIDLIKRAIKVAQYVGAPLVCFGSGFIREDNVNHPEIDPRKLLVEGIRECLKDIGDVTMVIEPEPGMYIETIDDGVSIVKEVNDAHFKLHIDINHVSCGDHDYHLKLAGAAEFTRYLHISDTVDGYNVKMVTIEEDTKYDLDFANYLIYFPERADYLLVDKTHSLYFHDAPLTTEEQAKILQTAKAINHCDTVEYVDYNQLVNGPSSYDAELDVYGFSIPRMSFYVVDRAKPILRYIRERGIATKMVANTLTGKVHFHEIPGEGEVDFEGCFQTLIENGYAGFGSVELYHHVDGWEKALSDSLSFLKKCLPEEVVA